ncbi:energy transducer TonB [Motiliproteus sp. MSK22-1]|uniref:energy transducer TonB n=1 Tax=Motiliproteus sp. MSK22-1 TaxID=1897630 RepID=UPI000975AF43|nr:energy transducer TonB [Motiliproteus sp. MSK22-1]OMH33671.1 hypothetical protein BGP75_11730 [Motiliproteus sp. MSK22-1]
MVRMFFATPLALCFALLLFYLLALMTSSGNQLAQEKQLNPSLDFLMVRQETKVELRKRQLPPEPEELVEQQQPEIPQVLPQNSAKISTTLPSVKVPDINMGVEVALSPTLHSLSMPTPAPTPVPTPAPTMTMDTNPTVLSRVPPRYPQRALRRRQQGRVVVEFTVTEAGSVKSGSVIVVESTPPGVFDKVVLRAIQRWRFKVRMINGQPVPFKARQELEFKLEK